MPCEYKRSKRNQRRAEQFFKKFKQQVCPNKKRTPERYKRIQMTREGVEDYYLDKMFEAEDRTDHKSIDYYLNCFLKA